MSIKKIENVGLCMAECSEHGTVVAMDRMGLPVESHLYMVTLTRECVSQSGTRLYPVVSSYHVIAQDEENAMAQVKSNAYPEMGFVPLADEAKIVAVATRIPFQIRGWGREVF